MPDMYNIERFLEGLRGLRVDNTHNPWSEISPMFDDLQGPEGRVERLRRHLSCSARLILVGEAPGYQGALWSGMAFTSERLLCEGNADPKIRPLESRLSNRPRPFSEPSATIVWGKLHELGIESSTVLWNAFPLHPHKPGLPLSNRKPSASEIRLGAPILESMLGLYPNAVMVAVGGTADKALSLCGFTGYATVRHPSYGGAPEFRAGLEKLCRE